MLYTITTTPQQVVAPQSYDQHLHITAGNFAQSADSVYIQKSNTKSVWIMVQKQATTHHDLFVPHGTQLEAYTNTGTADLVILKECC